MTSAPMMEAQVLSVMMFFTTGEDCPCTVTRLAIWMTGSLSGSGKWPCGHDPDVSSMPLVHQRAGTWAAGDCLAGSTAFGVHASPCTVALGRA